MKKYVKIPINVLLIIISFFAYSYVVNAKVDCPSNKCTTSESKSCSTYDEAVKLCGCYDEERSFCKAVGCVYDDSGNGKNGHQCYPKECHTGAGLCSGSNTYDYCVANNSVEVINSGYPAGCHTKWTCKDYKDRNIYVSKDDFGNTCSDGNNGAGTGTAGSRVASLNDCEYAYVNRNKTTVKMVDLADANKQYNECIKYNASGCKNVYNNRTITAGQYFNDYCQGECGNNSIKWHNSCVTVGTGGGGGASCVKSTSLVKDAFVDNVCLGDNTCEEADCGGDLSAGLNAVPHDINYNKYFNPNLQMTIGGIYDKAYIYDGTCDLVDADVYCIDPASAYHQMSNDYRCNSSLDEDSIIDEGFIKIYQLALSKYESFYRDGIPITEQEYQGFHFAFRFWTFYQGIGYYKNGVHNINIAKSYTGTAKKVANNNATLSGESGSYFKSQLVGNTSFEDGYILTKNYIRQGYNDSLYFFSEALKNPSDIWRHSLKFEIIDKDKANKIATVKLSGIQSLRDDRFPGLNFAKNIYCKSGCSIYSGLPNSDNYFRDGIDTITFKVKYTADKFVVGVEYYDRRDGKNVILAINPAEKEGYQRLIFVNSPFKMSASLKRTFRYQDTLDVSNKTCEIDTTGFYGKNGEFIQNTEAGRDKFERECCPSHLKDNTANQNLYCSRYVPKNTEEYRVKCTNTSNYFANTCSYICNPGNTNPTSEKCADVKDNKIVISDLTTISEANSSLTGRYSQSDDYCLSCLDSSYVNKTDYVKVQNNYCTVYCFEEYTFSIPASLKATKTGYGLYLSISIGSKEKEVCYTDTMKAINHHQFEVDLAAQKKNLDDAIKLLDKYKAAYNEAKNNMDKFTESNEAVCKTTKEETGPTCPAGTTYGTDKCKTSCEECTAANENGCIASKCTAPTGTGITYSTVNCDGNPTPKSYSYTSSNGVSASSGGSCSECSANNGSKQAVVDAFKKYQDDQLAVVEQQLSAYNAIINSYNSCYEFGSGYNSCNSNSDPYIKFTYNESVYMEKMNNNALMKGVWSSPSVETRYYGSTDQSKGYCTYSGNSQQPIYSTNKYSSYSISKDDVKVTENKNNFSVKTNKYVYTTETRTSTLYPTHNWYTKIPNGSAVLTGGKNTVNIGKVYPISWDCPKNTTQSYVLEFLNLGHYNNSCNTGRLNSVFNENDGSRAKALASTKNQCTYIVDDKSCEGCETTYYYRTISLNDVFPKTGQLVKKGSVNDSDLRVDTSVKTEELRDERGAAPNWTTEKGKKTQRQIEALGDSVYSNEYLEYSYTITPAGMKKIRDYNRGRTYGDFEITCDAKDIKCTSTFLNDIAANKYAGVKQNKRAGKFDTFDNNGVEEVWR